MAVLIFKAFQRLCMIGEDQNGKYGLFDGTFSGICIHFPPQNRSGSSSEIWQKLKKLQQMMG